MPVAVSVLREDQINSAFAANIEGLQALVPSVSFRKGNTTRNSAITIRGVGTISFSVAAEPSVSTVVDGVVLGRGPPSVTGTVTCPDNKTRIRVYLRKLRYRGSSLGQGYWGLRRTTVTCMLVVVGEVD